MRKFEGGNLFSASDLVGFLGCRHATALDIRQLTSPVERAPDDPQIELLRQKGLEHERRYLEELRGKGLSIADVGTDGNLIARASRTLEAMRSGADVIYQGALLISPWHGFSDFLIKVPGASHWGSWSYDVADTKLSSTAKPSHIIQLCVYAQLLAAAQGLPPKMLHVVLGRGGHAQVRSASVHYYYEVARRRFEEFVAHSTKTTDAEPCAHCSYCHWKDTCEGQWEAMEHLSLVAGISRSQVAKLRAIGVDSFRQLAQAPEGAPTGGISPATFKKLHSQASLQLTRKDTGESKVEILTTEAGKGFDRMPRPDDGDLFFDIEGDPLLDDGLEYLFGFVSLEGGAERFLPFWAHNRDAEKVAFENAVDFISDRLARYPNAHIYHYANYEEAAFKRLAMYHGTRETEVDNLLRQGRLVDLYRIAREAIRTSEPGLSIKNLEVFYLGQSRDGSVKTAGDSIVAYENWRATQDPQLLEEIRSYNELDCRSTRMCRDWLLTLRPKSASWRQVGELVPPTAAKLKARRDAEALTEALGKALIASASDGDRSWRILLAHLLEFHRREAKPKWWAKFARQEMTDEELLDDNECLAMLIADPSRPPRPEKQSTLCSFTFPAQDFKLKVGDEVLRAGSGESAGEITHIDDTEFRIELKLGPSRSRIANGTSLIPEGPRGDDILRKAIYRYATSVAGGNGSIYTAVTDIISLQEPRTRSRPSGAPILSTETDVVQGTIDAIKRLEKSYLLIQGPPGAGKTYVSSQAIVELLRQGARIGVASNSHKAINHLLAATQTAAAASGTPFKGIKKSSRENQYLEGCGSIENTTENDRAAESQFQLVAGTAWLFARPEFDQKLDYLFIDEAGQVSLANLIAMGVSAKNIVLVGDQMQLSQPIQGSHPGGSGISAINHLMGEYPTVPPARGVFLGVSRRMHPDVCRFISAAVYEGRLTSSLATRNQRLILGATVTGSELAPTGLRFVPVSHEDRAQKCPEEASAIASTFEKLMGCRWVDEAGVERPLTPEDILVVSPYNMQVELLRSRLPAGARVGTVDKFQGQEGAVVLISMATSSGEDLPRQIEFLYSQNRINVAISRARCLAVIFANLRLLEIPCATIAQMQLVNTLCWAKAYADSQ